MGSGGQAEEKIQFLPSLVILVMYQKYFQYVFKRKQFYTQLTVIIKAGKGK